MKRQVEIPVNDNYITTSRSLDFNHPDNVNLLARKNDQKYKELLNEVKIRFDTNPKYYQKEDYWKLIQLIDQLLEQSKSSLAGNKYNYFTPVVFLQGNIDRQSDCIIVDLQSDWIKKEIGSDTIYIKNG